ncbi:MAG: sodium:solute symporter [Flavobacteriales bacterium]|nr:sodium:solute symporter [Flavobacteriales bacterium]
MQTLDWIVLFGTLLTIVGYGTWKTRRQSGLDSYLKGDNQMRWATIGLSIMATQASAITFLSTPGKAYESGMEFVQFYIGLPIAMVILSAFVLPLYYKLKVYTAYEYLESRFDLKTRLFTAFLFLVQRGLAAGITIYAPAIILSTMLGWNLTFTNLFVGILVIIYTVSGGTRAVSLTQKWQMAIIMGGMFIAFGILLNSLPDGMGVAEATDVAGFMGRMNVINTEVSLDNRYTIWSGIFGGVFLFLSYFGTDQSQVQRYLGGRDLTESRMGLMFNGLLKVPMQFFILFVGVMIFVFYQFEKPPIFFNKAAQDKVIHSSSAPDLAVLNLEYDFIWNQKREAQEELVLALRADDDAAAQLASERVNRLQGELERVRIEYKAEVNVADPSLETKDYDYVFITWVMAYLPTGLVGLLFAVIFSAAMSSTSSELNALASTTVIDFYKCLVNNDASQRHYLMVSKMSTIGWGVFAILFAVYTKRFENLIEAVNILGSLFYGTVLGVFLVGFFFKFIRATPVFIAAVIAETGVIFTYFYFGNDVGFLWYNFIGCAAVITIAILLNSVGRSKSP